MYGGILAKLVPRTVSDRPMVVSFCGSDLLGEHLSGYLRRIIASYGVWASWKAARDAKGIVVKSKSFLEALPSGIPRFREKIISNGIALERFKPINRDIWRKQLGWQLNCFHDLFPTTNEIGRAHV
jgi:hypothetical protein